MISKLIDIDLIYSFKTNKTKIDVFSCDDIQSSTNFLFNTNNKIYYGQINTNWSLNINSKTTHLFFKNGKYIILDHSKQQVILNEGRTQKILVDYSTSDERLNNHYIGVFKDFYNKIENKKSNLKLSLKLHQLLFN